MLNEILIIFFIINAIFWGLFSHSTHCKVMSQLLGSDVKCPPHFVHLSFGIISFLLAILFSQQEYITNIFVDAKDLIIGAGSAVQYAKEQFKDAQDFRNKIENFINTKKSN
jgi:hypothetical protein